MDKVTLVSARGLGITDLVLLALSVTTIVGVIAWQLIARSRPTVRRVIGGPHGK